MKLPAKLIGAAVLAAVILTGCDLIEKPNTDKHKQHTESVPNQQGNNNGEAQGGSGSNSGGSSGGENATPDSGYDTYSSVEFLGDSVRKISKGNGGKNILVKGVTFTKKGGEEKLTITMTFCKGDSGETMSWDVQPNTSGN